MAPQDTPIQEGGIDWSRPLDIIIEDFLTTNTQITEAIAASVTVAGITFTAVTPGAFGNIFEIGFTSSAPSGVAAAVRRSGANITIDYASSNAFEAFVGGSINSRAFTRQAVIDAIIASQDVSQYITASAPDTISIIPEESFKRLGIPKNSADKTDPRNLNARYPLTGGTVTQQTQSLLDYFKEYLPNMPDTINLVPFVHIAFTIVKEELVAKTLSPTRLTQIAEALTCHFAIVAYERGGVVRSEIDGASETYKIGSPKDSGLELTYWGKQALVLDTSGTLSESFTARQKAEINFVVPKGSQ